MMEEEVVEEGLWERKGGGWTAAFKQSVRSCLLPDVTSIKISSLLEMSPNLMAARPLPQLIRA